MNAQALVNALYKKGAALSVENGKLLIDAPDDALDDELIAQIRQHKQGIIALLQMLDAATLPTGNPVRQNHAPSYECAPSLAQQRMLFMEELAGNNSYYNIPVAYEITGPLDKSALVAAFARLVAAHDILRSVYVLKDQAYVQRICEPAALAIREIDLHDETDKDGALQAILAKEADYRFNLQDEWPIKVSLIALGKNHHVLSINIHHIAADGWSARRIVDDIGAGYKACLGRADPVGVQRGYQYADYVAWQDAWQQSDRYHEAKAYWLKALDGAPQRHSLSTDFIRPSVQVVAGATWSHQVKPSLFAAIGAAARAFQTTPFVILQCGFAALLARYGGESDIVFGTATANRQPVEFVDTVGLFVNTLVLRYSVGDNLSFADLIEQGKQVSANAFRHQQLPFDVLVDILQPKRSLGYNPLVQIMLVMQESESTLLELEGAQVAQLAQHQQVSKFDFALHVHAGKDGFEFKWEFNTSLYTLDTIKAMSEHVEQLLSACLAEPERVVDSVPMIAASPAAADSLVQAHPEPECIHRLFEAQAALHPGAIAIIDGARTLNYQALDLRANELAFHLSGHLSTACDGQSARIGVCMEKSIDLVVAMLAIYKIGAVYVPLDPHYPKERIEFMIRDSGMKLLLVSGGSALPENTASQVQTLDMATLPDTAAQVQVPSAVDANAPAYIIYTSGSTGQPKGVLVTQSNLFHSLRANRAMMGITGEDIMPTIGSQAFGVSLLEILLPLTSGGAVRIVNKAQVVDIEKLVEVTGEVTVLHAVPSLMRQWLDAVVAAGSQAQYPHLRLLLVGGEAVPAGLLQRIKEWRPSVRLVALYGMTESTIVCSSFEPKVETSAHYCIGKPYASSRFYVLNRHGQQQPMGVPGELHIGGLQIAAEYINQPQMTDERFISLPQFAGERLYKTGDRVRLLADGNHEFMGRVDHQVSLRGARIELGEIEALAGAVQGVRQAVAHVVDIGADEQTLVLYYTPGTDGEPPATLIERIRSHLAKHLPDYMRPSLIQPLQAFPLNPNGKVDRKKLPQPEVSEASEAMVAPATEIEQRLAEIWKSVLQCDSVSVTANFFEMGGHSLMAAKLIAKIRAGFGISFPLAQLFESPTIRACALCVENALMDKYAQKLLNNAADRDSTPFEEMTI
jgi:amino acid adenylation domain-containing protein